MPRKTFVSDEDAIEDMPMRLLIIGIVMAITIPIIFAGLSSYREQEAANRLETELERFNQLVIQVYSMGVGTSQPITIVLPPETDTVSIGGDFRSPYVSVITYQSRGGSSEFLLAKHGNIAIPMTSRTNSPLTLGNGRYSLLVSKRPWDADGDELPDLWEEVHGADPNDSDDATQDPDFDTYTTIEEYVAQTDPYDSADRPAVHPADSDNDGIPDAVYDLAWPAYILIEVTNVIG